MDVDHSVRNQSECSGPAAGAGCLMDPMALYLSGNSDGDLFLHRRHASRRHDRRNSVHHHAGRGNRDPRGHYCSHGRCQRVVAKVLASTLADAQLGF